MHFCNIIAFVYRYKNCLPHLHFAPCALYLTLILSLSQLNSSTHLPKNTLASVADSMLVNASFTDLPSPAPSGGAAPAGDASVYTTAAVPPTVVEFDDTLSALWKQLRTL